ncbi:unnamed protein product [Amoebophrya sp. A25]|nr:unnamed protein product [Amoebophrya sp. A25]|eukprot:GSA25T00018279001.1
MPLSLECRFNFVDAKASSQVVQRGNLPASYTLKLDDEVGDVEGLTEQLEDGFLIPEHSLECVRIRTKSGNEERIWLSFFAVSEVAAHSTVLDVDVTELSAEKRQEYEAKTATASTTSTASTSTDDNNDAKNKMNALKNSPLGRMLTENMPQIMGTFMPQLQEVAEDPEKLRSLMANHPMLRHMLPKGDADGSGEGDGDTGCGDQGNNKANELLAKMQARMQQRLAEMGGAPSGGGA